MGKFTTRHGGDPRVVPFSFYTTKERARLVEAVIKLEGFESRSMMLDHALGVYLSLYKVRRFEDQPSVTPPEPE